MSTVADRIACGRSHTLFVDEAGSAWACGVGRFEIFLSIQ